MRQRFAKGMGGTLRCKPVEVALGIASAATVTLKRSTGSDLPEPVVGAVAAIDGVTGELSFVLTPANTPDPRTSIGALSLNQAGPTYLYRAAWTYTIAGVQYQTDQVYEVNARLLKPTLTGDDVAPRLPAGWDELLAGGTAAADTIIADAWDELLVDLVAHDLLPDRIMDVERLRAPHRSKVIAILYGSFGPQWAEEAVKKEGAYQQDLDRLLAAPGWYDKDQGGTGSDAETKVATSIVCTR
jgi:hypothetical protein